MLLLHTQVCLASSIASYSFCRRGAHNCIINIVPGTCPATSERRYSPRAINSGTSILETLAKYPEAPEQDPSYQNQLTHRPAHRIINPACTVRSHQHSWTAQIRH